MQHNSFDDPKHAISLPAGGETPAVWFCEHCHSEDLVVPFQGRVQLVVSSSRKILGAVLDADQVAECRVGRCLDCGRESRLPGPTA